MQVAGRGTTASPVTPSERFRPRPAGQSGAPGGARGSRPVGSTPNRRSFFDMAGADAVIDLRDPEPAGRTGPPCWSRRPRDAALRGSVASRAIVVAAVLIVVLNVLDIITTRLALANGAAEGNPIATLFVDYLPIFVAVKILVPASVALRIRSMRGRTTPMLFAAMWWVVGVYSDDHRGERAPHLLR